MLRPLTFNPIFMERVWGGRSLERLYRKKLPDRVPIGESWEITDRPEGVSVVSRGPLSGRSLRALMEECPGDLLGPAPSQNGRFPLLIKILDARETLSVQVHPPASMAARLGGEPKTEMWYVADAEPGAELYAGLRKGVTRPEFERRIRDGTVAECLHRVPVRKGDVMFLPSGRVHAIGGGIVIFEIQQNSDTTYRVFDWNRVGLDGKPRQLHVQESLQCINFEDFEPAPAPAAFHPDPGRGGEARALVTHPLFAVDEVRCPAGRGWTTRPGRLEIAGVLEGRLALQDSAAERELGPGDFLLQPAAAEPVRLTARTDIRLLLIRPGDGGA